MNSNCAIIGFSRLTKSARGLRGLVAGAIGFVGIIACGLTVRGCGTWEMTFLRWFSLSNFKFSIMYSASEFEFFWLLRDFG